eukprot:TRINITY_DN2264_c0_g1_i5.p1 TRINITY_DN2264_c0_g1~~TRINITY_DN2264_c0_g1_i5.p1  ORF type:complete len:908 (-),score=178.98 TRINITY_DN2264_c0_g1_i5:35-2476(-)
MAALEKHMREKLSSNSECAFQFPIQLLQNYNWHDWNPDKDENHGYDRMPGGSLEYHCYVGHQGKLTFKGPLKSGRKTHLQRVCGDSNVLQVHFAEDIPAGSKSEYGRIGKKGLCVGLRHYRFFVFKKSDKNEKEKQNNIVKTSVKCYFVCTSSLAKTDKNVSYDLFKNSMQDARCHFMHIHTVGTLKKYMHRFALVLSHTIPFDDDLSTVNLKVEKDILCRDENNDPACDVNGEPLIHTDGTGFISEDLASKIPVNVINGKQSEKQSSEECSPLLTQCRIFYNGMAIKGTLLSNRTLPENTICVRKSMVKVKRDDKYVGCLSKNSLEIVKTGYKPTTAKLSRPLIALLIYGGVPEELFINLSQKALNELKIECHEEGRAWKVLKQFSGLDDDYTALRMLACGIPLNEPYLQDRLKQLIQSEVKSIRKGKFHLENSYYLMGTADPSGKLKPDEVCIILEHGQVSGKVLVYRNPGSHFGDIHIYTAVYVKEIEEIVGDRKYAIFFSTRGKRSGADEIGGGDFDGDEYWVCKNAQILQYYKPQKPWERPIKLEEEALQRKPTDYSTEELEEELFKEYLDCRFSTSFVIGKAADSWLVYMDRLLTPGVTGKDGLKEKILRLVDIYYDALDAPKTGKTVQLPAGLVPEKRPHFLNKESFINTEKFYMSSSILGKLWDLQNTNEMDREDEISDLPCFQETTEECKNIWRKHYKEYLEQMHTALGSLDSKPSAAQIYTKYKEKLYEARSLQESTKNRKLIYKEACAIYQIAYKEARAKRDAGRCGFAWRVAGEALCKIYCRENSETSLLISASRLYNLLS